MKKDTKQFPAREEGAGRIYNESEDKNNIANRPAERDISEIDRQEGDMEHGELGGNFKQEINDHE